MTDEIGKTPIDPETTDSSTPTVTSQAASGIVWLTVQKWVVRVLGIVTIGVLTRLLSPETFGIVAAASTVLPFFSLLADLGFAAYIVQAHKTTAHMLSTGFWFASLAGLVLCGILAAIAPLLGVLFANMEVVPVLRMLSLSVVLTGFSSVPIALLRRSMRFSVLAWQSAVAAGVAQVGAIILAVLGYGVWALVAQTLISAAISCILSWIAVDWRPTLEFSRRDFRTMAQFGGQVLGVEFVAMARAWAEAAIISVNLGMAGLGFLSIAQRIVQVVQDLTGGALVPVSTVAFAKIRESPPRLRAGYIRSLRTTYAAMAPALTLLSIAAPQIVPLAFGDGWSDSYQVAQILALAATLTVGAALDHGLFYGLGKPGRWFIFAVVVDIATVCTTAALANLGLTAVAWGFLVVAVLATVVRWFLVAELIGSHVRDVAGPFKLLLLVVIFPGIAGWLALHAATSLPALASVTLAGLALLTVYAAIMRLFAKDVVDELTRLLRRFRWFPKYHSRKT